MKKRLQNVLMWSGFALFASIVFGAIFAGSLAIYIIIRDGGLS